MRGLEVVLGGLCRELAMKPVPGFMLNQDGNIAPDASVGQGLVLFSDDTGNVLPGRFRKTGRQPVDYCTDSGFFFSFAHHASVTRGRPGVNQSRAHDVTIATICGARAPGT